MAGAVGAPIDGSFDSQVSPEQGQALLNMFKQGGTGQPQPPASPNYLNTLSNYGVQLDPAIFGQPKYNNFIRDYANFETMANQPGFGQNLTPRQGNMYSQQATDFMNRTNDIYAKPQTSPYYNPPGSVISAPQPVKPMPLPGRPIIDRPAPGYGQQPTRGPAPRDMMPGTLQQGLGGLRR